MKIPAERGLVFAFGMAIMMLILAGVVAQTNNRRLVEADGMVNHTLGVMKELQTMLVLFQDIETGTRGYVITGDPVFLPPVRAAKSAVDNQFAQLQRLTKDNILQQTNLHRLLRLKEQQVTFAEHLIHVVETQGIHSAQKEVLAGNGKNMTDEIRMLIGDMQREEERLLGGRQKETLYRQKVVSWITTILSVLVISLLVTTFFMLRDYLKQRLKAENMLRNNRAALLEAERIAKMGNWILDPQGKVTWSPELYEIYRRDPQLHPPDFKGHAAYFAPEVWARLEGLVKTAMTKGTPYDIDLELIHKNGDRAILRASGRVDRNEKGNIVGLHGTVQDITESRLAFEREQELTRQAQAAEQAKAHFLAVMSHEIRTPMNGVLGFADLLAQYPLPVEQQEYVHTIQESGRALLRIINDILDYSRLESGKLEIENAPFSPARLMDSVRILLTSTTRFRPVEFKTDIDNTLPSVLIGDAGRLRQIMINLAGNSLKFTEEGSVTLGVRPHPIQKDGASWLEFYVRDTGIGISGEKVEQVFQPFVQADNSISRQYGGVGLGLSISAQLVKLLGGHISVESAPEKGTTFTFGIPLEEAPEGTMLPEHDAPEPYDESFAPHHPLNILVAEDDAINSRLIVRMLTKLGYTPRLVKNGFEAVEAFRKDRPNFVLMDLHMPEMDGLKATRAIRRFEDETKSHPRAYIAACTADVMPKERRQCFDYGMDDYLTKPLQQTALADALRRATAV